MRSVSFIAVAFLIILATSCNDHHDQQQEEWMPVFNGQNLDGWDIKIAGRSLNDNFQNTFRVQDSILRISYSDYKTFDNAFGHIYYNTPFSYYKLSFQYRFIGTHLPDAPSWADRNSGIMIHSQPANSLNINQSFPVSLEMQLLGGIDTAERATGNICTPGTQVYMAGSLRPEHCINSTSVTHRGEQWVSAVVEVYGDSLVRHIVEGDTVLTYTKPVIGGGFVSDTDNWTHAGITDSAYWIKLAGTPLAKGYIALQAESQPVDFRRLKLLNLEGCTDPKAKNYKSYFIKADNSLCKY
jgi:hypothetical protein